MRPDDEGPPPEPPPCPECGDKLRPVSPAAFPRDGDDPDDWADCTRCEWSGTWEEAWDEVVTRLERSDEEAAWRAGCG